MKEKLVKRLLDKFYFSSVSKFKKTCCIALASSIFLTGISYLIQSHQTSMVLTLNYANAKNGLTPSGSRFNIADIKSDEVLQNAINILNDDRLSVEELKDRITINTKVPMSSVENTASAIASDSTYSYCPSEFVINYSQKKIIGRNNTKKFMESLAESYKKYFSDSFADKNNALDYDIQNDLGEYDYLEQSKILYDKVGQMLRYLNKYNNENNAFRAKSTGYSFGNLITMLVNIRDVDIAKLDAYITQNAISQDKSEFLRKQDYNVEKKSLMYNKLQDASDIENDALNIYNSHITGVAFIPSLDDNNEFYMGRTKTGLDTLVKQSYDDGANAAARKKEIDKHNYYITKYSAKPESTEEAKQNTKAMISEISKYLEKISNLAVQTDDDYINEKTNNYITFIFNNSSLWSYIISFLVISILLFIVATVVLNTHKKTWELIKNKLRKILKFLKWNKEVSKNED